MLKRVYTNKVSMYDRNYWEGYMKDDWIVKVLGERKTAFGTAWYQLNHSSYDKTKKTVSHSYMVWRL